MSKKKLVITLLIIICITPRMLQAWDYERTHPDLSEIATKKSILGMQDYFKNIGFTKGIYETINGQKVFEWIRKGAQLEDKSDSLFPLFGTTRSFNHFHNPLKLWSEAGLDDWVLFLHYTGQSSLLWAQDGTNQQNFPEDDWSWKKTREYFYIALTGRNFAGSEVAPNEAKRNEYFAKTFRGLGHQMHLLQDTAVPDHVRNDAHPEDAIFGKNILNGSAYFETWAKEESLLINSFAANPDFSDVPFNISYNNLVPTTQLFDAELYNGTNPSASLTQGLAEYTNANFFSGDTIFAAERYTTDHRHYFPYPKKTSTDLQAFLLGTKPPETVTAKDGIQDTGIWISKSGDGENIEHLVKTSKLTKAIYNVFGEGELFYRSFYRDKICHEDYAQKLIPRAVGYSAGLLNYFFRGEVELVVYELIMDQVTMGLKLKVKNLTPYEEMKDGEVWISYRYKPIGETEFTYGLSNPVASGNIPYEGEAYYEFTFPTPIPADATDVQYLWVFKGTLGKEVGAVVGKVVPLPWIEDWELGLTGRHNWVVVPVASTVPNPTNPADKVADFQVTIPESWYGDFYIALLYLSGPEGPDREISTDEFDYLRTAFYIKTRPVPANEFYPFVVVIIEDPITGERTWLTGRPCLSPDCEEGKLFFTFVGLPSGYIVKNIGIGFYVDTSLLPPTETELLVHDIIIFRR